MPQVVLASEPIASCWDELQALARDNWLETDWEHKHQVDLDRPTYDAAQAAGRYASITARCDGVLIGYAGFWVSHNAHCRTRLDALQDVVYLAPEYRQGSHIGAELLRYSEGLLAAMGCHVVIHAVRPVRDFGTVLHRMGYQPIETLWGKSLNQPNPEPSP
jgi:hypothetical protein